MYPLNTLPTNDFELTVPDLYDICRLSMMERLNRVPHMYSLCFGYSRLPFYGPLFYRSK